MPYVGNTAQKLVTADDVTVTDDLTVTDDASVGGDLTVTGAAILNGGIDVAGNLTIDSDGGNILLKDGGTDFGQLASDSNSKFLFYSAISDGDIIFQGNDGGSTVTALTLDISDAGMATFNKGIKLDNGSGSALNDYEEGLHTATLTMGSGTAALSSNRMGYIKIGQSVTVFGELVVGSISSPSGGTKISLPFATAVATAGQTGNREHFAGTAIVSYNTPFSANNAPVLLANEHNVARCQITYMADDSGFSAYTPATGDTFYISFTYFTSV